MNEVDSFLDAAFETSLARLKKLLLVFIDLAEDVVGLLGAVGLVTIS